MRLVAAFMAFALLASPALAARGGVLPLSADDGWLQFGNFVVLLFASAALVSVCAYALRSLSRRPILFLVMFSVSSLVATIVADKTNGVNNLPPMPLPPRSAPVVATVTEEDVARGWRVECVTTNEAFSYTMPSNAVYVGNWHVHGARSSFGNNVVDFGSAGTPRPTGWTFPLGTNSAAFSSFWYFIDGRIRPKPKDAAREICVVGVPMSAVPGKSRLWAMADGDCRVLTWESFFLGGDTNAPVNAQIRLFANGDFTTRSNEVETVCRRVNPDDWDGDGLANEKDENPLAYDGEFFGAANAMPTNANLDAYYQLDVAAVGALDFATIRVTCDGPSDLGDHLIIARTNQVCHVPLLAGATYAVESDLPISYSAVSSEHAHIVTNSATRLTVSLPLEFSIEQVRMRSGGDALIVNYGLLSSPIDVGAVFASVSGGCCMCEANELGFAWVCSENCRCQGGHSMAGTVGWEGYLRLINWSGVCGCASDETESSSYAGDGITLSIDIPSTFIANDDGIVDATPPFGIDEDDVVTGRVSFTSAVLTNGVVKMQMMIGLEQGTNGARRVYADESGLAPIEEGHEYAVSNATSLERGFFINPVVASSRYRDGHMRALWTPSSGPRVAASRRFTVVQPTVEPITDESWSLADLAGDGRVHSHLYNPCAVAVGHTAQFKIDVFPEDYPDSEITWYMTNSVGEVEFVGGNMNTGRVVSVAGVSTGDVNMVIRFGDAKSPMPQFLLRVVESRTVKLRAWIIGNNTGWIRTEAEVRNMVSAANDIYEQIGVKLQLIEPIVSTNIPNAYEIALWAASNNVWSIDRLTSITNGTDGLECYFIHRIADASYLSGVNTPYGMVLDATADEITLAHEVGHALGMSDIYISNEMFTNEIVALKKIMPNEKIKASYALWDWNSGCIGKGDGGTRFYAHGTELRAIIDRMLMNGARSQGGGSRDITFGMVYGVWCDGDYRDNAAWKEGLAPVGIFTDGDPDRTPVHR